MNIIRINKIICYPSSILYSLTNLIVISSQILNFCLKINNSHKIKMYFNFSFLPSSLFLNLKKKILINSCPSQSLVVSLYADRRLTDAIT